VGVDCNGTVPVKSNKRPGQWSRNNRDMNESRMGVVTEVEGGQVEEIDDQEQLCPTITTTNEQHEESELDKIADYEMASYTSSGIDIVGIGGEERPNISDLQDE